MSAASSKRAFTLMEVLLAISLFGMAVVSLTSSLQTVQIAREQLRRDAQREADFRFVRMQALAIADREEFEEGGKVEAPSRGTVHWEVELEEADVLDTWKVKLLMEADEESLEQDMILYRKGWATAAERSSWLSDRKSLYEEHDISDR